MALHSATLSNLWIETLFAAAMDAVLQELNSKHFTIEYDGVTMSLETSDIYFLESHGHKVLIHCKEQDLTLRMSIPEALGSFPNGAFVSPHKSYLVNMEHIVYATGTAVFLSSGTSAADQQGGSVRSSIRSSTLIWEDDALLFR